MYALLNHSHVNEVQTVSQIFFPNSRFAHEVYSGMDTFHSAAGICRSERSVESSCASAAPVRSVPTEGWAVVSILGGDAARAEVYRDGAMLSARGWPLGASRFIPDKRAIMLSLFYALKEVADVYTPWGSLTGIRPSKLVRQWMDGGLSETEIIKLLDDPFGCQDNKARLAIQTANAEKRVTGQIYRMASVFKPVGLYVSIPFCPSRCLYCSFNMGQSYKDDEGYECYLDAIERDCKRKALMLKEMGGVLTSVYIGGGTPTVLAPALLDRLLSAVERYFGSRAIGMEYTVEAGRPDSLTGEKLRLLQSYGVNRVAINPQTLNDGTLIRIGRNHTARDFYNAYDLARGAGFRVINTDVIVGLPGETCEDVRHTMAGLTALRPENITVHTLAVKRASRLNENLADFSMSGAREVELMLEAAREACEGAGLAPYYLYRQKNMVGLFENTGYSLPGRECLYNVGMMAETQTVLGVGAGAVCKFVDGGKIEREYNVKNPEVYAARMTDRLAGDTRGAGLCYSERSEESSYV